MIEHYSSKDIETTNIEKDLNDTTTDTEMNFIDDSESKQGKSRKSVGCTDGGDDSTDKEITDSLNTVSNGKREKVKSNADLSEPKTHKTKETVLNSYNRFIMAAFSTMTERLICRDEMT